MITAEQCRAARQLLGWDGVQLATAAKCWSMTIHMFEMGQSKPYLNTVQKLHAAFESAGVEFLPDAGSGPGVRLKKEGAK